jgi:hypothetical protein
MISTVLDHSFWKGLKEYVCLVVSDLIMTNDCNGDRLKAIYEPLAISTNILQAGHTRFDHALVTIGNLYSTFSNVNTHDPELHSLATCVLTQLQKCFASTDQDVAILAVFCNPYLRYSIFSGGALSCQDLLRIADRLCRRFYGADTFPTLEFVDAFWEYAD